MQASRTIETLCLYLVIEVQFDPLWSHNPGITNASRETVDYLHSFSFVPIVGTRPNIQSIFCSDSLCTRNDAFERRSICDDFEPEIPLGHESEWRELLSERDAVPESLPYRHSVDDP
jgi:hypothetical protein